MHKIGIGSQSRAFAVIVEFLLGFRLLVVNVNITMFCSWWWLCGLCRWNFSFHWELYWRLYIWRNNYLRLL